MGTKILTNKLETKVGVEFSNAKIDKFKPTFGDTKARHLEFPFLVERGTHLKGLCLRVSKATKLKYFVLRYWHNKKLKRLLIFASKHLSYTFG